MRLLKWVATVAFVGCSLACDSTGSPSAPGQPGVPRGAIAISGTVSETEGGPVAGARVYAEPGGERTTSSADGSFAFFARAPRSIAFSADGFEDTRFSVTTAKPVVLHAKMRRALRIGVNSSLSVSLSPSDTSQEDTYFGDSWCEPCRVIRIQADSAGEIDLTVRWNSAAFLGLWDPQTRRFTAAPSGESAFTARVTTKIGETIVSVGGAAYIGPPIIHPMQFEVITRAR